ncbi:FAD binding domain-containing protein [Colletotrichum scovillei]|uniref:FAD binding domain-containing protein n=1 Tax=Colletotrichum scovillei TaxID=1209932 RepID=A0A9P7UIB4_9PEZI|nr:FAD binding domain-containing protein [Colletotrichum scovillei]KAF4783801.1 FAD binding domain-containing protein [Colletotrichum scovillei]KAG7054382.1 FAD binding domain-containing protein [Colletotrichum scovillei]KAG7072673.1 FAD binding domain-containing protein [Colletotrichum scovillei]KAG7080923.1 FAD binding domain-containing protein [Colletotrichum scovillei]
MGIKIIIVGGSVAGLSLANMLERFDIDYTILEAYSEIAPQVGASIGLLPNGLRILDQLGCYERLREAAGNYYHRVTFRDANGKPISSTPGPTMSERMEKHAGYASLWVDRQMLLQILYDNLKQKDKVLTNKRVVHVETSSTGVVITTEDGSTHTGDILVGGDGVHSKVREEMWRIASVSDPIAFPQEERSIAQSSMKCIFGISRQPVNFPPGATQQSTFFRGHLYLVISAPGNRVYWFLFHELGETKFGKDIPKFSKEDELLLSTQHREDHITEELTFGDLYDNRIKSTLVPLEEHVFRRWHFQRILIIGDAATKVHPISAQGGNGAIEAAANLVNALTRNEIPTSPDLQLEFIEKALSEVCAIRYERASSMMKKGRRDGAFLCQQPPFSGLIIHYVLPWLGDDLFFREVLKQSLAGPHIEKLPAPERPHTTPYNDELPPISSRYCLFGWTTGTLLVVTLGMSLYLAQSAGRLVWVAKSR